MININDKMDDNDDNDDKTIAYASDIDGNSLEIKQQHGKCTPEVMFHKAWKHKSECRLCSSAKREFNLKHFDERWLVLNRDMTGLSLP